MTKRGKGIRYRFSSILISLALLFAAPLAGQTAPERDNIRIEGWVKTAAGIPIAKVRLSIKNLSSGTVKTTSSTESGAFVVQDVLAGTYEITASATGFASNTAKITVGEDGRHAVEVSISLQSLTAAEGRKSLEGAITETTNSKSMGELPLNGRSASDVAALEPGVMKARTQTTTNEGQNGFGVQMATFGGRPRQNGSRLDGISVNDYANGPLGNAIGVALGVDALDQMSVMVSNDQAQYGRSSGGYISSSTRSGARKFHGQFFEYFRNSVLDAANYFDLEKPPFRRNQFGASVGGPVWKERTLFFASYEGLRQSLGLTNVASVPSESARLGKLSTGSVVVDPEIKRVLDAFYPPPNNGLLGAGDTGIYISGGQRATPGNNLTVRLDHNLFEKDLLSGVYVFDKGASHKPDKLNNKFQVNQSERQFLMLNEVHRWGTNSINSLRFGINRVIAHAGYNELGPNPYEADTSFGAVPGHTVPWITVPGLVQLSGGLGGSDRADFYWTSLQGYDDIALIKAKHSLKFGLSFEQDRNAATATTDPNGRFSFNSLSDFLTNKPNSLSVTVPGDNAQRSFRQIIFAGYLQDNWLVRRNITLNMGVRYEAATVPHEVHDEVSVLRNLTDAQPVVGESLFSNPTLRNFEPRFGFAWDPFGKGKTLVSSGFGIFDVLPLLYQIQYGELYATPFDHVVNVTGLPAGSYPKKAYEIAASSTTGLRQAYFEPNPHRNYVSQWNFTIQQELPHSIYIKAGYVGSRGVHHIFRVKDANIVLPIRTSQGYLWPAVSEDPQRLNTDVGRITAAFWEGNSSYNALVFQARFKPARRVQVTGSYAWGKAIDNSSGSIEGDEYTNALTSPLWFDTKLNQGLSDFNVAQDLKIIYSWEIGPPNSNQKLAHWALSGWQLGGVFEASTGVPFTPGVGGDPLGVKSTDPNLDLPSLTGGAGCESLVNPGNYTHYIKTECFKMPATLKLRGDLGRNTLIGPGLVTFDFSVFKNNRIKSISEQANVQFRAEFFNLFNHPNLDPPIYNRNIFDSKGNPVGSAGLIDTTQTPSRQIQFAIRLMW